MGVPQIAIVGRPNVGKSSVFNWLAGRRIAIVDPQEGVTRDRLTHLLSLNDRFVELVDTGGMGGRDTHQLAQHIEEQIQVAIDSAALILFIVDTREGVVPLDEEVAKKLRYVRVPVVCVANKTDDEKLNSSADEFYRLGRKVIRVSVLQNLGKDELLQEIAEKLPPPTEDETPGEEPVMKVAIVGRRNTGKSTLVNTLAESSRMITSELPGTTRDSVDVRFEMDGQTFVAIDTPGFKKKKSITTDLDFYSTHRAQRSIRRADVVLLFFDASQRIGTVDKQLCDYIAQEFKPCIFVVNKWDLVAKTMPTGKWVRYVRDTFRTMWHVPIAFITGQTGKNVKAVLNHAQMLYKQSRSRVATARLNKLIAAAVKHSPPPVFRDRRPKIYYGTQVGIQPPTIVMFCNNPKAFSAQYQRYLLGFLRDQLEFGEVPIKIYLRKREGGDTRDEIDAGLDEPAKDEPVTEEQEEEQNQE